jgi:hypothetical protein
MSKELVKRLRDRQEFEFIDEYKRIEWEDEDALEAADLIDALEAKLALAEHALRDLTNAFAKKVDVDRPRWKTPYEHPLSAYDRAVAFLKGDKP